MNHRMNIFIDLLKLIFNIFTISFGFSLLFKLNFSQTCGVVAIILGTLNMYCYMKRINF